MFTYNADSSQLFGYLYHHLAATHAAGEKRKIYDWDSGVYLGEIDEVTETYNVIGNMNEYGLAIGESTWSGLEQLDGSKGEGNIMDYGSLIYVTLERCKTASEAIDTMIELCNKYGYYSSGESFTIADAEDVWILDLIGKGSLYDKDKDGDEKICYVAVKIPDGAISGHANQARIMEVDVDSEPDPTQLRFAKGMKDFCLRNNLMKEGDKFDYAQIFNPISFMGARLCDARVYTFFRRAGVEGLEQYEDYITGKDLSKRMPLYFELKEPVVTREMLEEGISDHYEGTSLDMTVDVGAGPWKWGNRHHPLYWTAVRPADGKETQYIHERPIATQQTGWSFIAVLRPIGTEDNQIPIASMFYFGVDDAACSLHVPFYPGITRIPPSWEAKSLTSGVPHPDYNLNTFSLNNMFWVSNMVANFAYTDWTHIGGDVRAKRKDLNQYFDSATALADKEIIRIFKETEDKTEAKAKAIEYATNMCNEWATMAHAEWLALYDTLFIEYNDLVHRVPQEGHRDADVQQFAYSDEWRNMIVKYTGDHYLLPEEQAITTSSRSNPAQF